MKPMTDAQIGRIKQEIETIFYERLEDFVEDYGNMTTAEASRLIAYLDRIASKREMQADFDLSVAGLAKLGKGEYE